MNAEEIYSAVTSQNKQFCDDLAAVALTQTAEVQAEMWMTHVSDIPLAEGLPHLPDVSYLRTTTVAYVIDMLDDFKRELIEAINRQAKKAVVTYDLEPRVKFTGQP